MFAFHNNYCSVLYFLLLTKNLKKKDSLHTLFNYTAANKDDLKTVTGSAVFPLPFFYMLGGWS